MTAGVQAPPPPSAPAAAPPGVAPAPVRTWGLVLVGVLAPVPILAYDVVRGGWSTTLAALAAWLMGLLIFRGRALACFNLALLLNFTAILLLAAQFVRENGDVFAAGGDDRTYFLLSEALAGSWAAGDWMAIQHYLPYDSIGYIALGALLNLGTAALGDVNPLTIRVLGSFAGATLAPAAYLIGRELFRERLPAVPGRAALWVAVFPLLTYYAAMGLRDIWVAAATTWFVLAQLATPRAPVRGWVFSVALALPVLYLRPSSLAPLAAFALVAQLGRARSYLMMLAQGGVVVAGVAAVLMFWGNLVRAMQVRTEYYTELAIESAAVGSLGVRLLALPEPVSTVARFVYALYMPVPPYTGTGPAELLPGTGAVLWYLLIPLVVVGVWYTARQPGLRLPAVASAAFMLLLVLGIALTSIDVRHKTPLFSLAIVFAAAALGVIPRGALKTWGILYGCFMGLLGGLYLLIK